MRLVFIALLLASCSGIKPTNQLFDLPTYKGLVRYKSSVATNYTAAATIHSRINQFLTVQKAVRVVEQNPIRNKTDKVYLLYADRNAVTTDTLIPPPLRFWLTVDARVDSTSIYLTNFQIYDKRERIWQMLEKATLPKGELKTLWLKDTDALASVLLEEIAFEATKK